MKNKYKVGDKVVVLQRPKDVRDLKEFDKYIGKWGKIYCFGKNSHGKWASVLVENCHDVVYWDEDIRPLNKIEKTLYG